MGFLDSLRRNNAPLASPPPGQMLGGHPVSLGVAPPNPMDAAISAMEPFLLRQKNREIDDAKNMMLFNNIHQPGGMPGMDRIRQIADPNQGMNVQYQPGITDFQKASLSQNQQGLDLDRAKFGEAKRTGDEKLALTGERLKLDVDKNNNIYETKQRELEQKIRDSDRDAAIARERIASGQDTAAARDLLSRAQIAATDARHALDIAQRDNALEVQRNESIARIKNLEDQIAGRNSPTTEESTVTTDDETGNQTRTTTKTPGRAGATTTNPNAPKAPAGWKYIPKPGGGWTAVAQ